MYQEYLAEVRKLQAQGVNPDSARPGTEAWAEANRLAEKYGFFEIRGKNVYDYEVGTVDVPSGLFRNAAQGEPGKELTREGRERTRGSWRADQPDGFSESSWPWPSSRIVANSKSMMQNRPSVVR